MNTRLKNITTQYRTFNENQVLTEGQLNEFINYFEDQDRLSRTRLSGVGVACGFKTELTYSNEGELEGLKITQGVGVTTDGDLITLRDSNDKETSVDIESKVFTHYRIYKEEQEYPHFLEIENNLIELLTQEEAEKFKYGSEISNLVTTIGNKIVILYLESYSNNENPCEDADCDNQGEEQVANLRVLLVDEADVKNHIEAKDSVYTIQDKYEELYDNVKNIEVSRVILDDSITSKTALKNKFTQVIQGGAIQDRVITTLKDNFLDSGSFKGIAGTFEINTPNIESALNAIATGAISAEDYQYRFDLLKDLVDTNNEIKSLLLHLKADCCPDIKAFPKHLMLGQVDATLELGDYTAYRHQFYKSPIVTNSDENYQRVVMLIHRFIEKVTHFRSFTGPVKITPSNKTVALGQKAIPFYYNITSQLLKNWSFDKTQQEQETYNLSYHTSALASADFVQNPLQYTIDDNDFFRIEGHLGLPYKQALDNINNLKVQYGLPFDVVTLVLQKGNNKPTTAAKASIPEAAEEERVASIPQLRNMLLELSNAFTENASNPSADNNNNADTLGTIKDINNQLDLLDAVDFETAATNTGAAIPYEQTDEKDAIISELFTDFLERHAGLEHLAGVEPGGTFIMVYESETNNQVIADFALPYLCCTKEKPNIPPVAFDDNASVLIGDTVTIPVLDNDYDLDDNPLTVIIKTEPAHGTVVVNSNGTVAYTHNGSVNLTDAFTYCINDGKEDSNIATVTIGVKSPPVALDDNANTSVGGTVNIAVLDNDYDLGNTPLTVIIKTQPTHGIIALNADGSISYTHNGSEDDLADAFTYCVSDGELESNAATVSISIAPPPCDAGMDVVFIFDYTGSMDAQIEAAKSGVANIISTIQAQSYPNEYRLGLVIADEQDSQTETRYGSTLAGTTLGYHNNSAYTSLPANQKFVNVGLDSKFQWLTTMEVMSANNAITFTEQLNKLNNPTNGLGLGSGINYPEPTDMALSRVIENNFAGAFRDDVAKYIIIITDDTPSGNDDVADSSDLTEIERLRTICARDSIKVIVLGRGVGLQVGENKYPWQELATGTGGSWNESYSATTIQAEIINGCS